MSDPTKHKSGGKRKRDGVFQRGGRWWIRWTCSLGHDHRNPIGDTKGRALDEYHKRRAQVRRAREDGSHFCPRLQPQRKQPTTFGELLDDYLRRKDLRARDEAERKLRRRKEAARVELLRTKLGHLPVTAITAKDVEALYESLKDRQIGSGDEARPLAVATINRYMKLLHAVLRFGVRRGLLLTNPAGTVELASENNARNRCLSADEEARLMKALPAWMRPLVVVAIHTGMRRGELLGLRWEDVDLDSRQLHIRRDKAGDGRWVVLNSEAVEALKAAKRRQIVSPLVFCTPEGHSLAANFKRYWQPAVKAAGLTAFRFHDLRHTFASRLVARGVSSYIVQHAGGWRTPSMMQRYAHLDPATIRAAVALLALPEAPHSPRESGTDSGTATLHKQPTEAASAS
jgi:integrase